MYSCAWTDANRQEIVSNWLLNCICDVPSVTKEFELDILSEEGLSKVSFHVCSFFFSLHVFVLSLSLYSCTLPPSPHPLSRPSPL